MPTALSLSTTRCRRHAAWCAQLPRRSCNSTKRLGLRRLPLNRRRTGLGRSVPTAANLPVAHIVQATLTVDLLGTGLRATSTAMTFLLANAAYNLRPIDLLARLGAFLKEHRQRRVEGRNRTAMYL